MFRAGASVTLRAARRSRVMLLGGAPLVGERYLWWNFVSSSHERLESAKRDWKEGRFPKVPGDESSSSRSPNEPPRSHLAPPMSHLGDHPE